MADEHDDEPAPPPVHILALLLSKALTSLLGRSGHGFVLILTRERPDNPMCNDSAAVTNLPPDVARATIQSAIEALDRDPAAWEMTRPAVMQ